MLKIQSKKILLHFHDNQKVSTLDLSNSGSSGDNPEESNPQIGGTDLLPQVESPKMYQVLLLNDDYTPMEFVILVLRRFFAKTEEQASQIMLDVHRKGSGLAGVYTFEIAEMKTMQSNQFSQMHQHPLKCIMQEAPKT